MSGGSPTRLFKIDKDAIKQGYNENKIYGTLLQGEDDTRGKPYCAISHVWGNPTATKFQPVPWLVPVESTDKLLFILNACVAQGYEYVWFDILCVRQGRNDEAADQDKKRELPRMHHYYRGDTIVFGSQYKDFANHWDAVKLIVEIWDRDRMGKEADTRKAIWEGLGAIKTLIDDQWFWRVWTLQESVLPSRLLTSNGTVMDFRFCNLIEWTYGALGTKLLDDHCGNARYPWIHPGAGVVNDEGWWRVSQGFLHATENGRAQRGDLHPLEALVITKFRGTGHEIDKLRGAYGIINEQWHVLEENDFKKAWEETVDKYVNRENPDLAPLITMAITTSMRRTWGAGESERMGSVVPDHKWINKTAKLSQGTLNFTASGISKIKEVPVRATDGGGLDFVLMIFKTLMGDSTSEAVEVPIAKAMPYGDGSGELASMTYNLRILRDQHHVDVSSILSLIGRAVNHSKRHASQSVQQTYSNLEDLDQEIFPYANAVSSGLREIFCGWDRWIVVAQLVEEGPSQAFLAWFPKTDENEEPESVKERLNRCSLLWTCPGSNEWAVIVEEVQGGYRKLGIAFVDSEHPGPNTDVVVV